jgi:hypothetical protein
MSDEPTYVDVGDEFSNEDTAWRYSDDLANQDVMDKVFSVCRRPTKTFKTPKEARKWRKIDGQISRGLIPSSWTEHCIAWAKKKNFRVIAITVDKLGSYVINKAAMQDFLMSESEHDLSPKGDDWSWKGEKG